MKYFKIILILLFIDVGSLCSLLFNSCYIPQKGQWYEFRKVTLIEIHPTELGYDLVWDDGRDEKSQFIKDTTGCNYYIGMTYMIMIKK
jgi:hypothetical protein